MDSSYNNSLGGVVPGAGGVGGAPSGMPGGIPGGVQGTAGGMPGSVQGMPSGVQGMSGGAPSGAMPNGMPAGTPMSYGTGDIILVPDDGKKSRKGLMILLIVLAVLVVGAGVAFAVWQGTRGGGGSGEISTVGELEEKFNIYANYVISGEAKADPVEGEYDENASYALNKAIDALDTEYIKQAEEYWKSFYQFYGEQDGVEIDGVDFQNDIMSFVAIYYGELYLSDEILLDTSVENGVQSVKSGIWGRYAKLRELDYYLIGNYVEALVKEENAKLDLYDAYIQAGCVLGNSLDEACSNGVAQVDELRVKVAEASADKNLTIADLIVKMVLRNVWDLAMEMQDEE